MGKVTVEVMTQEERRSAMTSSSPRFLKSKSKRKHQMTAMTKHWGTEGRRVTGRAMVGTCAATVAPAAEEGEEAAPAPASGAVPEPAVGVKVAAAAAAAAARATAAAAAAAAAVAAAAAAAAATASVR